MLEDKSETLPPEKGVIFVPGARKIAAGVIPPDDDPQENRDFFRNFGKTWSEGRTRLQLDLGVLFPDIIPNVILPDRMPELGLEMLLSQRGMRDGSSVDYRRIPIERFSGILYENFCEQRQKIITELLQTNGDPEKIRQLQLEILELAAIAIDQIDAIQKKTGILLKDRKSNNMIVVKEGEEPQSLRQLDLGLFFDMKTGMETFAPEENLNVRTRPDIGWPFEKQAFSTATYIIKSIIDYAYLRAKLDRGGAYQLFDSIAQVSTNSNSSVISESFGKARKFMENSIANLKQLDHAASEGI